MINEEWKAGWTKLFHGVRTFQFGISLKRWLHVANSLEVFRNEILATWQNNLHVEVSLISEWIHKFRNKNYFYIHVFVRLTGYQANCVSFRKTTTVSSQILKVQSHDLVAIHNIVLTIMCRCNTCSTWLPWFSLRSGYIPSQFLLAK